MSDLDHKQGDEDPAALRAELARAREESEKALAQMRSELETLRLSRDSVRDVESVTEHIAMQQALDTIRQALSEKERTLDATADQCRRLEDELEDQRLAYDGLKHELDRAKLSLAAASEDVSRASQERLELEGRYQALLASERRPASSIGQAGRSVSGGLRTIVRFIGGMVTGILFAIGTFASLVWLGLIPLQDEGASGERDTAMTPHDAEEVSDVGGLDQALAGSGQPLPVVLGTVRDSLKDGSAGPTMVVLQGGDFTMGKLRALPGDDEGPTRGVRLDGYLIGETEVTFEEYDRFARVTGRRRPQDFGWGRGRRPVVDVSWDDARAYARWLSRQTGHNYRLPSEAEWEFAAAAGSRSSFWWGYGAGEGRAVCFDCGTLWDNRSSAPVATFAPNPLGLYDTAGNVMEWVEDCYHPSYDRAPLSGHPWVDGDCGFRVARGGAFNKPARSMRITARNRFGPDTRINDLGFRLARDE